MKEWFKKRHVSLFSHEDLVKELEISEPGDYAYMNFWRMGVSTYKDLLQMVTPFFEKQDTVMRNAIPASQRRSATLRFLVTGQAFENQFANAIAPQTLSRIVLQTCEAIIWALNENITVINSLDIKLENYDILQQNQS
jgi:hypothetical protein